MCFSGSFSWIQEKVFFFFCFVLVSSIASMEICQYVLMKEVFFGEGGGVHCIFVCVQASIIICEYSYCYQGSVNLGGSFAIFYIAIFSLNSALFS